MKITGVILGDSELVKEEGFPESTAVVQLLTVGEAAADAYQETDESGEFVYRGDPVEQAIVKRVYELGKTSGQASWREDRTDYMAFTSEQRFAAGLVNTEQGPRLAVNGAPSTLLQQAASVMTDEGMSELTTELRDKLKNQIATNSRRPSLRVNWIQSSGL